MSDDIDEIMAMIENMQGPGGGGVLEKENLR